MSEDGGQRARGGETAAPAHDAMVCRACGKMERASEGYPCSSCGTFICLFCTFQGVTICARCSGAGLRGTSGAGTSPA